MGMARFDVSNASLPLFCICHQRLDCGNPREFGLSRSWDTRIGRDADRRSFKQILCATVAYDKNTSYTRTAPGQMTSFNALLDVLDPTVFAELRHCKPSTVSEGVVLGRE